MKTVTNFKNSHPDVDVQIWNSRAIYFTDSFTVKYLDECLPVWVPERIKVNMIESLRGYNHRVASDIALYVIKFAEYGDCTFTEVEYIDKVLKHHYNALIHAAARTGIVLRHHDDEDSDMPEWLR